MACSAGSLHARGLANSGPVASSSRLDSIASLMRASGVSNRVIELAKRPQRESTSGTYNNQWSQFVDFCRNRSINPIKATEGQVADYLLSLFDRGILPATIKVHRSAIASVLKHTSYHKH